MKILNSHIAIDTTNTVAPIIEKYFHLQPGEIKKKCRRREIVMPRQIAVWFDYLILQKDIPKINAIRKGFGMMPIKGNVAMSMRYDINHATVNHCLNVVSNDMAMKQFRKTMIELNEIISEKMEVNIELPSN